MAVIVTMLEGSKTRRYAVCEEDEFSFIGYRDGEPLVMNNFFFGAQWLRSGNRVDEMYRTLSTRDIVNIRRGVVHDFGGDR